MNTAPQLPDLNNFTLLSDSYKLGHWNMMEDGTENSFAYSESRNGAKFDYTQFNGLQPQLKKHFVGPVITKEKIDEGEEFSDAHLGFKTFNRQMWEAILNKHGGYLPLRIRAVPEGMVIPIGHPLITVESTDESLPFIAALGNHSEPLLTHTWLPSNVATIGFNIKQHLIEAFKKAADTNDLLPFMLHDFGFRSVGTVEDGGVAGGAHLINFMGTDTIQGIQHSRYYYNTNEMLGYSVAASEHFIKTQLGRVGEQTVTKHLLEKFPKGILSDVQDSYDLEASIEYIGTHYKDLILNREGKYVFRPDSPRFKGDTPAAQILYITQRLEHYFGAATNKKGYKVLNPKVGIIYGDGLSVEEIKTSLDTLIANGYSPETCVYGMGGGLLQKHNRDTQRNAFKSSAQKRDGVWGDVRKEPKDMTKASKGGKVETFVDENGFFFVARQDDIRRGLLPKGSRNIMETVFENGHLVKEYTFQDLRNNAAIPYLNQ